MTVTSLVPPAPPPTAPVDAWRDRPAAQQPPWPDADALRAALDGLAARPPLTSPEECDLLRVRLAAVARSEAFLLQGGDCAETFAEVTSDRVRAKAQVLQQMSVVLGYAGSLPVVTVGRVAGQYAKPRSRPTETRDGETLPVYRGDAVNGPEFTARARTPDPDRLLRVYDASVTTLNLLRAYAQGGVGDLLHLRDWSPDFTDLAPPAPGPRRLARDIDAALRFLRARGTVTAPTELFTSHEALLLDYESALTRPDPRTGDPYDLSGHLLWIGERTRQLDGAHIAFAASVRNPLGVKLGPTATADEALALVDRLDPRREPGRLTFITRMGADRVRDRLPELIEKTTAAGARVGWVCDPMHGNTFAAAGGLKTRRFDRIMDEITGFFEVHRALGTHPGGLHLELTGTHVTECLGGADRLTEADLPDRYETACDPRLNRSQALELAFAVAELLRRP
ncbi:class II 3-deoxy-7-phosphoheptulonate synthase [Streptomyces sp. NPDC003077]|uniref:class II 3-deoxy-7-phosphoheptulonate synthase n=1 Tax=Streptomyces sp. NPDC003077 TaxID=3154443 RepID=UPI0033A7B9DB